MKTTQGSNVFRPIRIGRWTPEILCRSKTGRIRTGSCGATSAASPRGCSPETAAICNPQD